MSTLAEVILGAIIGNLVGGILCGFGSAAWRDWIGKRREVELERRVIADLLSRGLTFDHAIIERIGGDPVGPVTDAMVKRIADHCAMIMQFSHRPPDQP